MFVMITLLVASIIVSYIISVFVRKALVHFNIFDHPGARKIHKIPVVRGGGIAIFLAFFVMFLFFVDDRSALTGFYVGALLMFAVGLLDDLKDIKPAHKLIGQTVAVICAMVAGLQIEFITGPGATLWNVGLLSYPLTFFWLLGITNAINLIDGLDGLAGGVGAISSIVLGVVALSVGRTEVAMMAFILAGATIGFLPHNFSNKKKMFMGDSGSQFLGFSLAALSIMGITKIAAVFTMLAPIMILAIPIFDTLYAFIRRAAKRQPFYIADRGHLHHRLLDIGFTERKAVTFIYYVTILLGLVAIYATWITPKQALILFIFTAIVIISLSYLLSVKHKSRMKQSLENK